MILLKKIQASSMQLAVLISAVVIIMLSAFVMLTHTQRFFKDQSKLVLSSISQSQSHFKSAMELQIPVTDSMIIELDYGHSATRQTYWGAFKLQRTAVEQRSVKFELLALTGSVNSNPPLALQLGNPDLPLVVAGQARIFGDARLSDKGIKAGVIKGNYYTGGDLVYGRIFPGNHELPKQLKGFKDYLELLENYIPQMEEALDEIDMRNGVSFKQPTKFSYHEGNLYLDLEFTGNIIVLATNKITIGQNAELTDVVVVAPEVIVESGFRGGVHIIASKQIIVEENCQLNYPSSLVMHYSKEEPPQPGDPFPIQISDGAQIDGAVLFLDNRQTEPDPRERSYTHISISDYAIVNGQVYSEGNLELFGKVNGQVYTERFISNVSGSKYINHLYNGQIDARALPDTYVFPNMEKSEKGIAKWLY